MSLTNLTPLTSPLDEHQLAALRTALGGLSPLQLAWVSGYLAGRGLDAQATHAQATHAQGAPATSGGLAILYGSQTGNCRGVAESLAALVRGRGFEPRLVSLADYRSRDIARERLLLLLVSTQGEGEPPESALDLFKYLHGGRAPRLEQLRYAVLGLGDSSYAHFCATAKAFDARLGELGAQRLLDLQCCDLAYQEPAAEWSARALETTLPLLEPPTAKVIQIHGGRTSAETVTPTLAGPRIARLLERRRLTTADAVGEVHHLALAIDPEQLRFTPGDALGVWFRNDPALVEAILETLALDGASRVQLGAEDLSLRQALAERLEITQLHPTLVEGWSAHLGEEPLAARCAEATALRAYAGSRQVIDLVREYPGQLTAAELTALLQPLRPRLYSIASSQAEIADELHLTVSLVRYQVGGQERLGGASGFLAQRLGEDEPVRVAVTENPHFRLPTDGDRPLILVGAGTGVAPFRAFLQQRAADGARGRNWLVFGNRHYRRDFLYQLDWQAHRKAGRLDRVSVAFSRDQGDQRYVQHRLLEQGRDIHAWLEDGAHLYVCGSTAMGQAVQESLLELIARERSLDREGADDYLDTLRQDGRYQRDLY